MGDCALKPKAYAPKYAFSLSLSLSFLCGACSVQHPQGWAVALILGSA